MNEDSFVQPNITGTDFDYSFVPNQARVAVYDDLMSSPRIIDIMPDTTREFINTLATTAYTNSQAAGGKIPYSIILQVTENFIHARFTEVVVSILDDGNTIRFSDQGPGIADKEKAQQPGYSSATSEMKRIIHGVGSGLPIVREYMETKSGMIQIEDNINSGAVVTISLAGSEREHAQHPLRSEGYESRKSTGFDVTSNSFSKRALSILHLFNINDLWGVKDISEELNIPLSSTHAELKKLEEAGMITKLGKKRVLTDLGVKMVDSLV